MEDTYRHYKYKKKRYLISSYIFTRYKQSLFISYPIHHTNHRKNLSPFSFNTLIYPSKKNSFLFQRHSPYVTSSTYSQVPLLFPPPPPLVSRTPGVPQAPAPHVTSSPSCIDGGRSIARGQEHCDQATFPVNGVS